MELLRKLWVFISNPAQTLWWAKHSVGEVILLCRQGRLGALIAYFVAAITGWRVYDHYIDRLARRHGGTIEREVRGHAMELNLEDEGISRDLFLYGVREQCGTEIFQRELECLQEDVEDPIAIDIGANIGYFALTELDALGESGRLIAFEPDDRSATLLERNLELNGYRDCATIERAAVGPKCGIAEFELYHHTNLNRVQMAPPDTEGRDIVESVTVDMWSIDEYLSHRDLSPKLVVAVRMDVEGYEVDVVRGMERLLAADGPLVLSIEVHPGMLDPAEVRGFLDQFEEHGFVVVGALTEVITADPLVGLHDVDDISSLPDDGFSYNLILRKDGTTQDRMTEVSEHSRSALD